MHYIIIWSISVWAPREGQFPSQLPEARANFPFISQGIKSHTYSFACVCVRRKWDGKCSFLRRTSSGCDCTEYKCNGIKIDVYNWIVVFFWLVSDAILYVLNFVHSLTLCDQQSNTEISSYKNRFAWIISISATKQQIIVNTGSHKFTIRTRIHNSKPFS